MDVQIPCPCPGTPHAEDTVTLRDKLAWEDARAIDNELRLLKEERGELGDGQVLAHLSRSYLIYGIRSWTLVDEKGEPIVANAVTIRERLLETDWPAANAVAEVADALYHEAILLPLVRRVQQSSPPMPIEDSTSAQNGSGPEHPKPSKRSSTSTTRTADTGTTSASPAGVSS